MPAHGKVRLKSDRCLYRILSVLSPESLPFSEWLLQNRQLRSDCSVYWRWLLLSFRWASAQIFSGLAGKFRYPAPLLLKYRRSSSHKHDILRNKVQRSALHRPDLTGFSSGHSCRLPHRLSLKYFLCEMLCQNADSTTLQQPLWHLRIRHCSYSHAPSVHLRFSVFLRLHFLLLQVPAHSDYRGWNRIHFLLRTDLPSFCLLQTLHGSQNCSPHILSSSLKSCCYSPFSVTMPFSTIKIGW